MANLFIGKAIGSDRVAGGPKQAPVETRGPRSAVWITGDRSAELFA